MTIPPIITPLLQWSDADGHPYAGGSIATLRRRHQLRLSRCGSTLEQTALATNPVILDSAGRCYLRDGAYRLILRDTVGNLISDFCRHHARLGGDVPVVSAPTIADAVHLLGLDDTVTAAELAAAVAVETSARRGGGERADHRPRRRGGAGRGGRGGATDPDRCDTRPQAPAAPPPSSAARATPAAGMSASPSRPPTQRLPVGCRDPSRRRLHADHDADRLRQHGR